MRFAAIIRRLLVLRRNRTLRRENRSLQREMASVEKRLAAELARQREWTETVCDRLLVMGNVQAVRPRITPQPDLPEAVGAKQHREKPKLAPPVPALSAADFVASALADGRTAQDGELLYREYLETGKTPYEKRTGAPLPGGFDGFDPFALMEQ